MTEHYPKKLKLVTFNYKRMLLDQALTKGVVVKFTRDRTLVSVIKNGIQFYFMVLTVFRIKTFRVNFLLTSYLFINFLILILYYEFDLKCGPAYKTIL